MYCWKLPCFGPAANEMSRHPPTTSTGDSPFLAGVWRGGEAQGKCASILCQLVGDAQGVWVPQSFFHENRATFCLNALTAPQPWYRYDPPTSLCSRCVIPRKKILLKESLRQLPSKRLTFGPQKHGPLPYFQALSAAVSLCSATKRAAPPTLLPDISQGWTRSLSSLSSKP